ncbi:MAG: hypothetical protein WD872_03975 [Pirellulaceae bacterium]
MLRERLLEVVESLPDNVDLDELIEKLYLLKRLEVAEEELAAGSTLDHAEVEKRFAPWLE